MSSTMDFRFETCWKSGLVESEVPSSCKTCDPVMLGIDEAGRGPVLGPMMYAAAYWRIADETAIKSRGFDDSKALSFEQRAGLFEKIKSSDDIGWAVKAISAEEISREMLARTPYSLNAISHDAAIFLVRLVRNHGVNVQEVYVDTVGDPEKYQAKLTKEFNNEVKFTVRKKADSLFKVVSAASICAKVLRDTVLEKWVWKEKNYCAEKNFGSGYPSDPRTVAWLENNRDLVFGYPNIVRFSWQTISKILDDKDYRVEWPEDDEDADSNLKNVQSITSFYNTTSKGSSSTLGKRGRYYLDNRMTHVSDF